jgi:hypothetical protein
MSVIEPEMETSLLSPFTWDIWTGVAISVTSVEEPNTIEGEPDGKSAAAIAIMEEVALPCP